VEIVAEGSWLEPRAEGDLGEEQFFAVDVRDSHGGQLVQERLHVHADLFGGEYGKLGLGTNYVLYFFSPISHSFIAPGVMFQDAKVTCTYTRSFQYVNA
jgi:hypothetical protein